MKKNILWLGMLALALVFGMTLVGCGGDDGGGDDGNPLKNTTWGGIVGEIEEWNSGGDEPDVTYVEGELKFTDNTFELSAVNYMGMRGNYSTKGSKITITYTQIQGFMYDLGSTWYTKSALVTALKAHAQEYEEEYGEDYWMTDEDIEDEVAFMFSPQTIPFSINGNTLTITMLGGEVMTFTKK